MVSNRIAVGLSATALVVALLGSTSAGRAALDAVVPVPLAKRAYLADTAKNAVKVNNIKASATPTPGMLLPLDSNGKLPASIGAVGPQGQAGPKGDKGDKGDKGKDGTKKLAIRMSDRFRFTAGTTGNASVACEKGERAVGGGAGSTDGSSGGGLIITDSRPAITGADGNPAPATPGSVPTGWIAGAQLLGAGSTIAYWAIYVICVSP